jgi:glycine/D-amino acid oxidase-like deaminating enzyme
VSPGREAWRRFKRHRLAVVCTFVLGFIILAVLLGPWIWRVPINEIDFTARMQGPSWAHPLGTDDLGQDLLARMLYGGRVSYSTRTPRRLAQSMQARMVQTFPQLARAKVEYAWGGFVDISMNRAPDFGRLSDLHRGSPDGWQQVYYLQGFSGHGLALTGMAGKLVAEAVKHQLAFADKAMAMYTQALGTLTPRA